MKKPLSMSPISRSSFGLSIIALWIGASVTVPVSAEPLPAEASSTEPVGQKLHPARDQLKHDHDHEESTDQDSEIEEVVVTGHQPSPSSASSPLLSEQELQGNRGSTLGELMESIPGVSNASFGQGVARPVVRGMSGNRVQILTNGSDTADLSAMSSDHAPMADLAAASSVQLMRGPSALRFGNSVLGGVVNVESGRIHEFGHEGVSGSVTAGYASNNQQSTFIGTLDAGDGNNALHIDGFIRDAENYSAGQGSGDERSGEILNSDTSSQGAGIGYTRNFDSGSYVGLSISQLSSDYAVPNEDNEDARVKPQQTRYDLKGAFYIDAGPIYRAQLQAAHSDYEHDETTDETVVGLFEQTYDEVQTEFTYELESGWHGHFGLGYNQRHLELCHDHSGCDEIPDRSSSSWDGTQGADFLSYQGYEFAHDTPMPLTTTKDAVLYLTGSQLLDFNSGLQAELELGLRYQPRTISADPDSIRTNYRQEASYYDDKTYHSLTASASLELDISDSSHVILTLSRQQRAPVADELYWNGDHHATFSFQLDNPDLDIETAHAIDLSWEGFGESSDWQVSTYFYDYDGYIYNELKDFGDPYHGNNVYRHEQADAQMAGLELSWDQALGQRCHWQTKAASNRGWLTGRDSGDLPRMPADNLTQQLRYQLPDGEWLSNGLVQLEWQFHAAQNRLGPGEISTGSYYLLNLGWSTDVTLGQQLAQISLKGNNLTDQFGQQHVSWLKDYAPVMGRNITMEMTLPFGRL